MKRSAVVEVLVSGEGKVGEGRRCPPAQRSRAWVFHFLEDPIQMGLRVIEEDETAVEVGRVVVAVFLVEVGRAKQLRFVVVAGERPADVVVAAETAAIPRRRGAPASEAHRLGDSRRPLLGAFEDDEVIPVPAEVEHLRQSRVTHTVAGRSEVAGQPRSPTQEDGGILVRKPDDRAVVPRGFTAAPLRQGNEQVVGVEFPIEGVFDEAMEVPESRVARDFDPPPRRRADPGDGDLETERGLRGLHGRDGYDEPWSSGGAM